MANDFLTMVKESRSRAYVEMENVKSARPDNMGKIRYCM